MQPEVSVEKKCTKCDKSKPTTEFYTQKKGRNGLRAQCKECDKKETYTYRENHPGHRKKESLKRKLNHGEEIRAKYKAKYQADGTKERQWAKEYKLRRNKWYRELKSELGCERCGLKHPACLHFHHKDPSTKKSCVSNLIASSASKEEILSEIAKCNVLCANCHAILHWEERQKNDLS